MFAPDIDLVRGCDAADLDAGGVESVLAAISRLRGGLDALEARLVRRAEQLSARGAGGGAAPALRNGQRVSRRQVDRTTDRAATLAAAPVFEAALARGAVGSEHVDALTRAAGSLPEERRGSLFDHAADLAEVAAALPADAFDRHCRQLVRRLDVDEGEARLARQKRRSLLRRWTDATSGMWCLRAELDPESGAIVSAALDGAVERLVHAEGLARDERTAAAGLVALACGTGRAGGVRTELLLVADVETWRWGLHDDSVCETNSGLPLPPQTLRWMSCDADVDTVVLDGRGLPLSVGRARRSATRAQRRALRAMYRTCGFGDCDRPFDRCEIHHLDPWNEGGSTDLDNLLPLCVRHHHLVHDGGWRLALFGDRTLVVSRPDGTVTSRHELPTAPAARAKADERAEQTRLARQRVAALISRAPP